MQRQHPNTEGLTDDALKSMYNSSVIIPAIQFLSSFCCFALYIQGKKKIDALQVEKENSWRRPESNPKKEGIL